MWNDARCSTDQSSSRVSTSYAASFPRLPFEPGISNHFLSAAEPPDPGSNTTSRPAIARQVWLNGITSALAYGLNEVECQFLPPAVLGQTSSQSPTPASAMSWR